MEPSEFNVLQFTVFAVIIFVVSAVIIAHLFEKAINSRNDDRK